MKKMTLRVSKAKKSEIRLQTQLINRQTACEDGRYMKCLVEDIENVTDMLERYARAVHSLFNVLDQRQYMQSMTELKRVHEAYNHVSEELGPPLDKVDS